jgi:hypothetical protein
MGCSSFYCKGNCGKPIRDGEEVIQIKTSLFDGYPDHLGDGEGGCVYHRVCFEELLEGTEFETRLTDYSEGAYDPDQGAGYPDPEFLPAGTVLYPPEYDVLKGVGKVGICIDVSGSMAFDLLRGGMQLLSGAEAAMHYLGIKEIEVITFDYIVQKQATMPVEQLGSVLFDHDGSWRKGGGGTDMRPPIEAAVKAGCGAIVVVGDLYGQLPEDPGVPVIWLCPVDSNLIEKNYDAGKRGQDCYDGAPKPPYGDITYFESYPVD